MDVTSVVDDISAACGGGDVVRAHITQQLQYASKNERLLAAFECNVGEPVQFPALLLGAKRRLACDTVADAMPNALDRELVRQWRLFGITTPTRPEGASGSIQLVAGMETIYSDPQLLDYYLRIAYPTIGIPFYVHGTDDYICAQKPCTIASALFHYASRLVGQPYATLPAASIKLVHDLLVGVERHCANAIYWRYDRFSVVPTIFSHAKWRTKYFLFGHTLHSIEYAPSCNARYVVRFTEKPFSLRQRYDFDTATGRIRLLLRNSLLPRSIVEGKVGSGAARVLFERHDNAPAMRSLSRFAVEFANALAELPTKNLKTRYLASTIMAGMLDARNTLIDDDDRALLRVAQVRRFLDFEPLRNPCEFTAIVLHAAYMHIVAVYSIGAVEKHYGSIYRQMAQFFMNDAEIASLLHRAMVNVMYQLGTLYFDAYETDEEHAALFFVY